jgi:hypothetical protein
MCGLALTFRTLALAIPLAVAEARPGQAQAQDWRHAAFPESARPSAVLPPGAAYKQASEPADTQQPLFGALAGLFFFPNTKQSICVNSQLFDVEEYPGDANFRRADVADWARSTVRIRVTHASLAGKILGPLAARLHATSFSMGGFTGLAGKDEGICTGTLIAGNIILTAGHCIAKDYWVNRENLEYPYFTIGDRKRELTEAEFATLLVVDFNDQADLSPVVSIDNIAPAPRRPLLSFTVRSLTNLSYDADGDLDFAILHVAGAPEQIGGFALGAGKIRTSVVETGEPVAVIQHPFGGYKKVATGLVTPETQRILHTASTATGSSGAALLDKQGRLVGIQLEGQCQTEENANLALPMRRMRAALYAALNGREPAVASRRGHAPRVAAHKLQRLPPPRRATAMAQ